MAGNKDLGVLFTELGAAVRDTELGVQYASLYSMEGTLDRYLGPGGDEAAARALWGMSWEALKSKGQEFWDRVSPQLHTAFCDPNSKHHKELAGLLRAGETAIGPALAALCVQAVGALFPALAASAVAFFVARLILEQFVTQGYGLACDTWEASLKKDQ